MAKKITYLLFLMAIMPVFCFAEGMKNIHLFTEILSFLNLALLITCVMSLIQFFFPGERNRTPFQIFNAVFIIVFYIISLTFLIRNKEFYDGFEQLSGMACIQKVFFDRDISTAKQWFVVISFIINILYVVRNGRDEYFLR